MTKLTGDRLTLRPLELADITDEYVDWHKNEQHTKYYSSSGKEFTRDVLIRELEESEKTKTLFIFGLFFKENNKLIGNIKVGPVSKIHKTSDLIVFIGDTNYLGKGLAVEGIKLGNEMAFKHLGIRKLFGGMFYNNIASVKAYTRADWVIEGVLKAQYLVDGKNEDRILVGCFNPDLFNVDEIRTKSLKIEDIYG